MGVKAFLLVLRDQWRLLVVAAVLGAVAAGGMWSLSPRRYDTQLQMYASYVSPPSGVSANDAYSVLLLSQQRVTSYVELVSSDRVLREVIRRLGLQETPDELAGEIRATSPPSTVLIDVTVQGTSPTQVASIANTVGAVMHDVVAELDAPTAPTGTGQMTLQTVEPASVPTSPSSIGLPTALVLGLLGGLVIGVGAAFLRHALDTSVRTVTQLRAATGVPILGTVSYDPAAPGRPLAGYDDAGSLRAEEFLRLRTNLGSLDADAVPRVILVTSAVEGEGKSTTVCNLAAALVRNGRRVIVVDADLRRPGISGLLHLESGPGLTGVLTGQAALDDAVQHSLSEGFDVLPRGPSSPYPSELLSAAPMREMLSRLREDYSVVLIDSPAVLRVADAAALTPLTDGVLLVCRYHRAAASEVRAAVEALHAVSANLIGTVFTMVPRRGPHAYGRDTVSAAPSREAEPETEVGPAWVPSARGRRHAVVGGDGLSGI